MENQVITKIVASNITIEKRVSKKGNEYLVFCAVVDGKKKTLAFVPRELEFEFYKAGLKL